MANRFSNFLIDLLPRTGRLITESGDIVNEAGAQERAELLSLPVQTLAGNAYRYEHWRLGVHSGNTYYYSLKFSTTKYTALYFRSIETTQGPLQIDVVRDATYTPGETGFFVPSFSDAPQPGIEITEGATGVTGGVTSPSAYIFDGGNKVLRTTSSDEGVPTITKQGAEILLKFTNLASPNVDIRMVLVFTEIDIPDHLLPSFAAP